MRDLRKGLHDGRYDVEAINKRMPWAYWALLLAVFVSVASIGAMAWMTWEVLR
jgi:hypothetical protein